MKIALTFTLKSLYLFYFFSYLLQSIPVSSVLNNIMLTGNENLSETQEHSEASQELLG